MKQKLQTIISLILLENIQSKMTTVSHTQPSQSSSKPSHKNEQFQQKCGECFLLLEQYKLKTNFIGCNMTAQEVKKYYNYYESKSKKRLQFCRDRLEGLKRAYERNFLYLQALELKTVNNMMKVFRRRMDILENEPTDYHFVKFQEDEEMLNQWIITNDHSKINDLIKLSSRIKSADSEAAITMQKLLQNNTGKKPNIGKAFKTINKSETVYCRYMETFQRSIANMVNQIHSHIEKLSQFYNLWENLGSSLIYQMKSDREVFIDKTLEERRNRNYSGLDETQEEILQVIQVLPTNSKMREHYQQKLEDLRTRHMKSYSNNTNTHFNTISMTSKHKKGNLKLANQAITKVSWYETEAEDIKQYTFNDNMLLREKEEGYFRYTYEELHHQTVDYLENLKAKKNNNDQNENLSKQNYFDRFYVFCQKKDRFKEQAASNTKIEKFSLPPYMSFNCWFDRLGCKGVFNIQDFPINIFQRKLQYQNDRQIEMLSLDENRRKDYNNKQSKLHSFTDQGLYSLGYKELNPNKEVQKLRLELTKLYDAEYLPKPKNEANILEIKKLKQGEDFSQSQGQENNKQKQTVPQENMQKKPSVLSSKSNSPQKPTSNNLMNQKKLEMQSEIFETQLQALQKQKQIKSLNQQKPSKLKESVQELQKSYPWFQVKEISKEALEVFVECYLPELERSMIRKMKSQVVSLGYTEQEIEMVSYKYLPSFQASAIARSIMQTNKKLNKQRTQMTFERQNINKMYLVNKLFYVKIDPIFFHNSTKIIKIDIVMISQVHEFQKLKSNLQAVLSKYGRCNFHLNMDLIYQNEGGEQKMFSLIGHLLRDQKIDKNLTSILGQSEKELNLIELVKQGQQVFQLYESHYRNCIQLEKERK